MLTKEDIIRIGFVPPGAYIQSFKSATEAGRVLKIDRKAITNNCLGKSRSSGGFIWSKIKKENYYD